MSPDPQSPATPRPRSRRRAAGDRAMQRATVAALVVGLVLDAVVIAVAGTRDESSALLGALVGTALTLVMVLPTVAITFVGTRLTPVSMAATVLGSWAAKMLVVILVLIAVRDLESVSTRWIGLALLVGAVSAVIVEAVLLARSRHPLEVQAPGASADEADPQGRP